MENEHLELELLASFSRGDLPKRKDIKVARHLLKCPECRKRMPPPTRERVQKVYEKALANMRKTLEKLKEAGIE